MAAKEERLRERMGGETVGYEIHISVKPEGGYDKLLERKDDYEGLCCRKNRIYSKLSSEFGNMVHELASSNDKKTINGKINSEYVFDKSKYFSRLNGQIERQKPKDTSEGRVAHTDLALSASLQGDGLNVKGALYEDNPSKVPEKCESQNSYVKGAASPVSFYVTIDKTHAPAVEKRLNEIVKKCSEDNLRVEYSGPTGKKSL